MRLTKMSDDGMVVWTDEALYNGKIDKEKIINRLCELEEREEYRKSHVSQNPVWEMFFEKE